eukprot:2060011-Pleurochrysis_carterae.AAC.1
MNPRKKIRKTAGAVLSAVRLPATWACKGTERTLRTSLCAAQRTLARAWCSSSNGSSKSVTLTRCFCARIAGCRRRLVGLLREQRVVARAMRCDAAVAHSRGAAHRYADVRRQCEYAALPVGIISLRSI